MSISVIINGAGGIMGKELQELIKESDDFKIEYLADIKPPYLPLKEEVNAHCIIDFSHPFGLNNLLSYAMKYKIPLVIGTTGYSEEQIEKIKQVSNKIPIFLSSNFCKGVELFTEAVRFIANNLDNADIAITEIHRKGKKDKPSGTAKRVKEALECENKSIETASLRMGDIQGEHSVYFTTSHQQIIITHRALSRKCFTEGVLCAVRFIIGKPNGFYTSLTEE